jgi:hypothetical protein
LPHSPHPEALENFYGERTIKEFEEFAELRINDSGRVLTTDMVVDGANDHARLPAHDIAAHTKKAAIIVNHAIVFPHGLDPEKSFAPHEAEGRFAYFGGGVENPWIRILSRALNTTNKKGRPWEVGGLCRGI